LCDKSREAREQRALIRDECFFSPLGTHDLVLLRSFFRDIVCGTPTKIPSYDKSAFNGQGDRAPTAQWQEINTVQKVQVLIFEGWSVGFRALEPEEVARKREAAEGTRTLRLHALEHLLLVNSRLREYDVVTDLFDAFIHLDAEDTLFVYDWRIEQETKLRKEKGTGMTDEQVVKFVDAYYPAYELFSDKLKQGLFSDKPGHHLRLIVGKDRKVREEIVI
jgi:D-glycerate 3-kinase